MKYRIGKYIIILLLVLFPVAIEGQIWPFGRRSQAERATRDLQRRQRQAGEQTNHFNPLQPMGSATNYQRDDHIWSSETAYLSTINSGNVSVTSPSRLGIHRNYELQSMLGAAYWVPNLLIKRRMYTGTFGIASRHGIYSPTNGLKWAQKEGYHSVADTTVNVPQIFSIRNELIVSRPFIDNINCTSGIPWLIITAAISVDYGFPLQDNDLPNINEHILGSRSPALIGNGFLITGRVRADARLNNHTFIEGGIKYFTGDNDGRNSFEHHAALQYFLSNNFSVSPGYILSMGDFSSSNMKIFPFFDLTWYFGQKPRRRSGLFGQPMF